MPLDHHMDPATASAIIAAGSLATSTAQAISNGIGTNRTVTIEFVNRTPYFLVQPDLYMDSGRSVDYPPAIAPMSKVALSFSKKPDTACGAVGCITYKMYAPTIDATGMIHRGPSETGDSVSINFCCSYSGKNYHGIFTNWQAHSARDSFKRWDLQKEGQYHEINVNDNLRLFSTMGADGNAIMNAEVVALQDWQWDLIKKWKRTLPKY